MKILVNLMLLLSFASPLDSLLNLYNTHLRTDNTEAQCEVLEDIFNQYYVHQEYHKADSILSILKEKAELINSPTDKAKYYFHKSALLDTERRFDESIKLLKDNALVEKDKIDIDFLATIYTKISHTSYITGKKDQCIKYTGLALGLINKVEKEVTKSRIYNSIANKESAYGTQQNAIIYAKKVRDICIESGNKGKLSSCLYNIGYYFSQLTEYDSSAYYFTRGLALTQELKDSSWQIRFYEILGDLKITQGETEQALAYIEEGKNIALLSKNKRWEGNFMIVMGKAYLQNGDLDAAELIFTKAYNFGKEQNLLQSLVASRGNLITLYREKKDLSKALNLAQESHDFYLEHEDIQGQAVMLATMGDIKREQGQLNEALKLHKGALKIQQDREIVHYYSQYMMGIADDFHAKEEPDSMIYYVLQAEKYTANMTLAYKIDIQDKLAKAYEQKGEYEKALTFYKAATELKKESINDDKQDFVAKERVKQNVEQIETEKKIVEQEAALLSARNKLFLVIGLGLLSLLLLGSYLFSRLRSAKLQLEDQNLQLEKLNATKDKFFGIIAHDIRSPLVALSGVGNLMTHYIEKDDKLKLSKLSKKISGTANELSGLLDSLLNWALLQQGVLPYNPKPISVNEAFQEVAALFKENANNKDINLKISSDENSYVYADEPALSTILRNLVSNAIKYSEKGGMVSLSTEIKDDKIFLKVNDTGTGIAAQKMNNLFSINKESKKGTAGEKGTGLGLNLINELTKLNNGILDIKSTVNEGTQFTIGLPIAS